VIEALEQIVGAPFSLVELKRKPGRRLTLRARGPHTSAIVKVYASDRARLVAARIRALAAGPPEPAVPEVLHVDAARRTVILSDVSGRPLREALLEGALNACAQAGAALGVWHGAWRGGEPDGLRPHTVGRELEILRERSAGARTSLASAVEEALPDLGRDWTCSTVVHRDLYEEQLLIGRQVGLIDLDDAALGPPELDVGNLLAHVDLLERRSGRELGEATRVLLGAYADTGPPLDFELLDGCRRLTLVRLACINDDPSLLPGGVPA
jgi:Ser/Thr protein kinase RdoA (MazF antagonist)